MKKYLFISLLAISAVFANAQTIKVAAGVTGGLDLSSDTNTFKTTGFDLTVNQGQNLMNLSAFVDATYAEVDLSYLSSVGKISQVSTDNITSKKTSSDVDQTKSFFGFAVFGKYPLAYGAFGVEPKLGVKYNIVLSSVMTSSGVATTLDEKTTPKLSDFSDFYLSGGVNLKYDLTSQLFLVLPVTLDYNLTPAVTTGAPASFTQTFNEFKIDFAIGAGYKF